MVASTVVAELAGSGRSKRWLSAHSGIAYSTLRRKLAAQADITVTELAAIAAALGVSPAVLVPRLPPEEANADPWGGRAGT